MTGRAGSGADRRAQVEARLLAAAKRLLDRGAGFTELGVKLITDEAGVGRSSFYTHFRDKTELLLRLARTFEERSVRLVAAWQADDVAGLPGLVALYERLVALYREHAAVVTAVAEVSAYDARVRESWRAQVERAAEGARARLLRDQRAGLAPADLDAEAAGTLIVWGGSQAILHHLSAHGPDRDAAFAGELARIVWHGAFRRPAG
ncbi:TetR/AcrR family transcriptional regulator [Actinacidiphila acididurans]|uniref:TetR/AcrR family transcriptional regulator n=1 Tax=Actinacidiphila acididurans TaxID=2784346 RepID=A0ABS2TZD0_9ACTN|nr:TetR/AcrR family transcriptional regulator [Actinacidiphila acididurans]MBM9508690.1 TetR/AcrR family transcriptional regulator [Actinacidiphila acididurans]